MFKRNLTINFESVLFIKIPLDLKLQYYVHSQVLFRKHDLAHYDIIMKKINIRYYDVFISIKIHFNIYIGSSPQESLTCDNSRELCCLLIRFDVSVHSGLWLREHATQNSTTARRYDKRTTMLLTTSIKKYISKGYFKA